LLNVMKAMEMVRQAGCLIGRARCLARPRVVNALTVCIVLRVHFPSLYRVDLGVSRKFCMEFGDVGLVVLWDAFARLIVDKRQRSNVNLLKDGLGCMQRRRTFGFEFASAQCS
jgi:hypothetical protein